MFKLTIGLSAKITILPIKFTVSPCAAVPFFKLRNCLGQDRRIADVSFMVFSNGAYRRNMPDSVVERRTPEREVEVRNLPSAVLCP